MSSDFSTVLVKDARLAGITDNLSYAVQSGASSNTYQEFQAIGPSNSQLAFNIQVPSENVVVSREIFLKAKIKFTVAVAAAAIASATTVNAFTPNKGGIGGVCLNAFPLNQLINTATAQINNTNVSANTQDILPILLQLADQNDLYTYNDTTACHVDRVVGIYNSVGPNSSIHPFGNMFHADPDGVKRGRGVPQLKVKFITARTAAATGAVLGSYDIAATTPSTSIFDVAFEAELIEPLIGLSPFTYGNNQFNKAGLVGINSMNIVLNIDGTLSRLLGTSAILTQGSGSGFSVTPGWTTASGATASTTLFDSASLLVNFLSSQPTDLIPARNIVPYVDLPRYITAHTGSIASAAYSTAAQGPGTTRLIPGTATITSSNIQLNQLPDYFIIAARIPPTNPTYYPSQKAMSAAPCFMAINSINVNLNNTSGLLSSASSSDLYRISVSNHSNQTWTAWSGTFIHDDGTADDGAITQPKEYPSVGSILVLNPAKDLSLPDYLSSGSLGSFNFQFSLNVSNYHVFTTAFTPEIVVIAVNSGIFTTIAGSSNIFTGLLTKSMVLDAKKEGAEDPINSVQYERLAGGAMMPNSSAKEMAVVKDYKKMKGMGIRSGGGVSTGGKQDRFAHLTM